MAGTPNIVLCRTNLQFVTLSMLLMPVMMVTDENTANKDHMKYIGQVLQFFLLEPSGPQSPLKSPPYTQIAPAKL